MISGYWKTCDWAGYFAIFIRKPRGAAHSSMYKFLPVEVQNYLEGGKSEEYRERLKFIYSLLRENYPIESIGRALQGAKEDGSLPEGLIRHLLYRLTTPERPLTALNEDYTPNSVRDYKPQISAYNRLMPIPTLKGGETNDQTVC